MKFRPADEITGYHVHIYYDGATKQWAGHLRREVAKLFPDAEIGRWRRKDRIPNPTTKSPSRPSCSPTSCPG